MATIDPNDVASASIQDVQGAIDKLSAMIVLPGADIAGINGQITALQGKQGEIRTQALRTIEDSPENKQAIAAMNAAAAALKTEAAQIGTLATALTQAAKVVTAATSLITTFAPFI